MPPPDLALPGRHDRVPGPAQQVLPLGGPRQYEPLVPMWPRPFTRAHTGLSVGQLEVN